MTEVKDVKTWYIRGVKKSTINKLKIKALENNMTLPQVLEMLSNK